MLVTALGFLQRGGRWLLDLITDIVAQLSDITVYMYVQLFFLFISIRHPCILIHHSSVISEFRDDEMECRGGEMEYSRNRISAHRPGTKNLCTYPVLDHVQNIG